MPKLILDGRAFKDAAIFTGNEETRYYLKGVCVEPSPTPGKVLAIATDGHRMAIIEAIGQVDASRPIISLDCLAAVKKAKAPWIMADDAGTVTVWDAGPIEIKSATDLPTEFGTLVRQQFPLSLIDGTFPEWQRVLPATLPASKEAAPASFNSAYLADFAKVATPGKQSAGQAVRIVPNGDKPAWVFLPSRPDFVGVIMPMPGDQPELPSFLQAPSPIPQAIAAE